MAQTGLQVHKEQVHVHVLGMRGSQGVAIRHAFFQGFCAPLPAAIWQKMCPSYTKTWLAVRVLTIIITIWKNHKIAPEVLGIETSRMATHPGKYCTYCTRAIEIDLGRCANSSGTPWQSRKVGK